MARAKRKKKTEKETSRRLKRMAAALAVLVVAIFAMARFLETPRGGMILLDLGFDGRYAEVRQELDEAVLRAAESTGMPRTSIGASLEEHPGGPGRISVIEGEMPPDGSLLQLNAAVTAAVEQAGGRIRACREIRGGSAIEMTIGTRRVETHRCVFRLGRRARREDRAPTMPEVSIVVDDFGYFDNRLVRRFLALEIPLTVSVLPGLKHSGNICREAAEAGKETICHLPMEPEKGGDDGGEIPLVRTGMKPAEIEAIVEKALETTPGVIGMNNHMGSKATADPAVMSAVMSVCRRKGIFFLDSVTTPRSVVGEAAAAAGVPSLSNDIFIDNRGDDVRENLRKLISIAERKGTVTGIMHVRRDNLGHLEWFAAEAEKAGVRIVPVSSMIGK